MKNLLMREEVVGTEYGSYRLQYRVHEIKVEEDRFYGVSIFQFKDNKKKELFDHAVIKAFSESFQEVKDFFETLIRENVFPVHLYSIADDWICAIL